MKPLHQHLLCIAIIALIFALLMIIIAPAASARHAWQSTYLLVSDAARQTEDLRYIPDETPADHWLSPKALLERGGGDCEDFVHYWYSFLKQEGVSESVMEIRELDNSNGTSHLVLIVENKYVLSAGESHQGLYEMSYLDLWN